MAFPNQEHIDAAREAQRRLKARTGFSFWPSAALGQALIESAGATRLSGKHNYFGIKATPAQIAAGDYTECATEEVRNGRRVVIKAKFANFASLADAYEQRAMLFIRVKLYAPALKATNPRQFILEIAKYYATSEKDPDPKKRYSYVVISAMDRLNLYRYDEAPATVAIEPLKPPAHATAPAKGQAAAGAAIAAAGAAASQAQGAAWPFVLALVIAALAVALAAWRYAQAHNQVLHIPLTPGAPSPEAAALPDPK